MPDGLPLQVTLDVDGERGHVTVDLARQPRLHSRRASTSPRPRRATGGRAPILMVLEFAPRRRRRRPAQRRQLPGCFDVLVRENCVAGIPVHPASCSMATGEVGVRDLGDGDDRVRRHRRGHRLGPAVLRRRALPRGRLGRRSPAGPRPVRHAAPRAAPPGGPGTAETDGWLSLLGLPAGGLLYRDFDRGAGAEVSRCSSPARRCGPTPRAQAGTGARPANLCEYGPIAGTMRVFWSLGGRGEPARGRAGRRVRRSPPAPTSCRRRVGGGRAPRDDRRVELHPFERVGLALVRVAAGTGPARDREPSARAVGRLRGLHHAWTRAAVRVRRGDHRRRRLASRHSGSTTP